MRIINVSTVAGTCRNGSVSGLSKTRAPVLLSSNAFTARSCRRRERLAKLTSVGRLGFVGFVRHKRDADKAVLSNITNLFWIFVPGFTVARRETSGRRS